MNSSTGWPAGKNAIVAIPARIGSTRLTRKVLLELDGRPMLRHVMNRCGLSEEVSEVWVVTDSQEVARAVESWDGNALMSDPDCPSGTARIASVIDQLQGDPVINVQADQPLVEPELISSMISALAEVDTDIVTPVWRIHSTEDMEDPALAKVVRGHDGQALYFSRSPVPYVREHQRLKWPEVAEIWNDQKGGERTAPNVDRLTAFNCGTHHIFRFAIGHGPRNRFARIKIHLAKCINHAKWVVIALRQLDGFALAIVI